MALARAPLVMAMPPLAAMALARAPLVMAMPPLAAVKLLCGRLSNAQRFGSDACVCCRVASFAPCTNDAVFRMTSGRPSSALVEAFCLKLGAGYRYHSMRPAGHPCFSIPLPVARMSESRSCGASGSLCQDCQESHLELTSVGQGFGLPLRSVSAARNTHTTILELPLQR